MATGTEARVKLLEERLARLEGAYEHMATEAQIVRLETHVEVLANAVNHALSQIQADLVQMRKSRQGRAGYGSAGPGV